MHILIDGQTFETPEIHRGIGVYAKNVLNQMVKNNYENEWYIAVSDTGNLVELDPWVLSRLHVIVSSAFRPGSDYARNRAYTEMMRKLLEEYRIDAYWNPNPLMVNVLFLEEELPCRTFITVHDLIPLIFPIKEWPRVITEEYNRRLKMIANGKTFRVLFDSEWTQKDWIKHFEEKCISQVTKLASDERLFYIPKKAEKDSENPYILFTGGFDYRKNIDGAIDGFALARKKYARDKTFQRYKLKIVGKYDDATKKKYDRIISAKHLEGVVELTGYVDDEILAKLYQNADLFFFPSVYEGFGLPLLEAMLGGAYIVSADNSSLPEVCGKHAVYFNVEDQAQMADMLYQGYRNHQQETLEDIRYRQEYARSFTWERTARETLDFIEAQTREEIGDGKKPSLAVFTPWPSQKTGIANYESKMMPALSEYFRVTVFTNAPAKNRLKMKDIQVHSIKEYSLSRNSFDYRLYQIGNNAEFHQEIFEMLEKEGGIAEIHDYILTPFFYVCYGKNRERFTSLLKKGFGEEKGKEFAQITENLHNHPDIFDCPMSQTVVEVAEKTIFHNHWSSDQIRRDRIKVIPLPSFPFIIPGESEQAESKRRLTKLIEKKEREIIVGCFGWLNMNKRPQILLAAIKDVVLKHKDVKLVFWGENHLTELMREAEEGSLKGHVSFSGYISMDDYYTAMAMSDIVVNLRFPSMGEASGTLCEAFQMGKPVIVSDLNQYREYPDDVCWKLPVGEGEAELLSQYITCMIEHPEIRETLGNNAKRYAEYALNPKKIAKQYYRWITSED